MRPKEALGAFAITALAAAWNACGGGANQGEVQAPDPGDGKRPTADCLENHDDIVGDYDLCITPPPGFDITYVPPTEAPIVTIEPTAIPELEKIMTPREILEFGNRVLANYPETPDFDIVNIKLALESAANNYDIIESGSNPNLSPKAVLNEYGNASLGLMETACDNSGDEQVGLLWLETRKFFESYGEQKLGSQVTHDFLTRFYTVPSDCSHPVLNSVSS